MTTQQDRIHALEVTVTRIDTRLDGMEAHMATKEEVQGVRTEIQAVRTHVERLEAQMQHMATKADVARQETRLIKWMVGTAVASAIAVGSIAYAVAYFLG